MNTIIIDPAARTVTARDIPYRDGLREWQAIVGGSIEAVVQLDRQDEIYANESGRYVRPLRWWSLHDQPVVISGAAFVVNLRMTPSGGTFAAPRHSLDELRAVIEFLTKDEARERFEAMRKWREADAVRKRVAYAKMMGVTPEEVNMVVIPPSAFPEE